MVKHIIVAILLLPIAEIAVFLLVAALIGFLGAFTLMLATTLAGVVVLRRAGRGRIAQFRVAVSDGEVTGVEANTGGFLTVLAGLLLVLPGFVTDLVGAALLIRPLRQWCGRTVQGLGGPPANRTTRRDRSFAGRMAAGARPRNREPLEQAKIALNACFAAARRFSCPGPGGMLATARANNGSMESIQ